MTEQARQRRLYRIGRAATRLGLGGPEPLPVDDRLELEATARRRSSEATTAEWRARGVGMR